MGFSVLSFVREAVIRNGKSRFTQNRINPSLTPCDYSGIQSKIKIIQMAETRQGIKIILFPFHVKTNFSPMRGGEGGFAR